MTEVRRYTRRTASGKTASVRRHTRNTDGGGGERERAAWAQRAESSRVPHVSELPPAETDHREEWWAQDDRPPPGEFWDEDDAGEDGEHLHPDWHNLPQDEPEPEMSDAFRAMVAQNPSFGDGFERLKAQRDAGYGGWIDPDGNPVNG